MDVMSLHVKRFYKELIALYKKYDLSISHEDSQGGFIIENYNKHNVDWIMDADIKARIPEIPYELSLINEDWFDEEQGVGLMNTENSIVQVNGEVYINCKQLPTCPSNSKRSSVSIIGDKIYMNGYEYKNGEWKRTLPALFYNMF